MVEERISNIDTILSAEDTSALLNEADLWRGGLMNHSVDDRRALSLYWTAAAGKGPAAGVAMNRLAWIYLVPTKFANPVSMSTPQQHIGQTKLQTQTQPGIANWAIVVAKKYFGIHLSQLWFVSVGRRLGWIGQKSASELQFSESKTSIPLVERDIEAALALWTHAAKGGNADAQYALSVYMMSGAFMGKEAEGASQEAEAFLRNYFAAIGGSSLAQMSVGYRHSMGIGVPKSCLSALNFYELAANQAVASMRVFSGEYPGLIVLPPGDSLHVRLSELETSSAKETDQEVVDYLEAAAIAGDASAILNLGHIYLAGNRGVAQDINKAIAMYRRVFSMKGASGTAAGVLGALTYGGVGMERSCEHAAEIWRIGELAGDSASLTGMGVYHSTQCGENPPNVTLATEYWEQAAQRGHMDALYLLGVHYLKKAEDSAARTVKLSRDMAAIDVDGQVDEGAGSGRARASFFQDRPGREATREVAANAREEKRASKRAQSLQQRLKEATLSNAELDPEKEQAIRVAEAEFAEREEARWAQAAVREEARLEAAANLRDEEADKAARAGDQVKELQAEAMVHTKTTNNHLHKAISCLSTAAQHGHILALHAMGNIHGDGRGVARNCPSAVNAFKTVAERGEPTASITQAALGLYRQGDYTGARILYVAAAEAGVEVAQSNAAWLLERGLRPGSWELPFNVCGGLSRDACEKSALRLWKLASKQNNADATVMVGDYSYYGRGGFGGVPPLFCQEVTEFLEHSAPWLKASLGCLGDPASAAKYYSIAADMKSPQALFNLAFMHHIGIGVERDVHLAKRYYDAASVAHPHAVWPSQVGLTLLSLEALMRTQSSESPAVSQPSELKWGIREISWSDELAAVDTIAVLVLSTLLLLTISLRNHHREHRRLLARTETGVE